MRKSSRTRDAGLGLRSASRRTDEDSLASAHEREEAFRRAIFAIPPGKVSTYGAVAARAGYPRYHRAVARLLRQDQADLLPWHRVVGADGEMKTTGASQKEQRMRLRREGVKFHNNRVALEAFLSYRPEEES